ncbi:MAG TPA: hypothetical protein VGO59_14755 [Verrucomicrobiae bacterium]|jgi:hypothetical protein
MMVKYSLAPLIEDGRDCLVCHDVEGMEWAALEWVEFYYAGSPWQRIIRESDDIFALVENEILKWPPLERITAAGFRVRLNADRRARRLTVRSSMSALGNRDGAGLVIEKWLVKRGFMEIVESDRKSVE